MDIFEVKNFGPIQKGEIEVGDLTVFIGPQASGKTLAAQAIYYLYNGEAINKEIRDWFGSLFQGNAPLRTFFAPKTYEAVFTSETLFKSKSSNVFFNQSKAKVMLLESGIKHSSLYVPAQRAGLFLTGQPMPFNSMPPTTPFVVRFFSQFMRERIFRNLMQVRQPLFPRDRRLKEYLRNFLYENLLMGTSFEIRQTDTGPEVLGVTGDIEVSFDGLASGLKESFPLLIALQEILSKRKSAVIGEKGERICLFVEEPETNLHPNAIKAIFVLLMFLVTNGHKVLITTHSPYILELLQYFQLACKVKEKKPSSITISRMIADFIGINGIRNMTVSDFIPVGKEIAVNYFKRTSETPTTIKVIKDLTEDDSWGGLLEFTSKVSNAYVDLWKMINEE